MKSFEAEAETHKEAKAKAKAKGMILKAYIKMLINNDKTKVKT